MMLINSWGYDVVWQELGSSHDAPLAFGPFLKVLFEKAAPNASQKEAVDTFRTFDIDGDGFVTAQELREGFEAMGDEMTEQEANEMVKDADVDGDGRHNYIEYKEKLGFSTKEE